MRRIPFPDFRDAPFQVRDQIARRPSDHDIIIKSQELHRQAFRRVRQLQRDVERVPRFQGIQPPLIGFGEVPPTVEEKPTLKSLSLSGGLQILIHILSAPLHGGLDLFSLGLSL